MAVNQGMRCTATTGKTKTGQAIQSLSADWRSEVSKKCSIFSAQVKRYCTTLEKVTIAGLQSLARDVELLNPHSPRHGPRLE